jgi:hypothetical protein
MPTRQALNDAKTASVDKRYRTRLPSGTLAPTTGSGRVEDAQPHRRRLVKAKERIAHPLPRRIARDVNDAHKTKSQRVGHPEPSQPVKDAPPAAT